MESKPIVLGLSSANPAVNIDLHGRKLPKTMSAIRNDYSLGARRYLKKVPQADACNLSGKCNPELQHLSPLERF